MCAVSIKKIRFDKIANSYNDALNNNFIPETSIKKINWGNKNGEVELVSLDDDVYLIEQDGIAMGYTGEGGLIDSYLSNITNDSFITFDYSKATTIPSSLIQQYAGPHSMPRIILANSSGEVIGTYGKDVMGETASVAKIFVALAACELLDPNYEIEISEEAIVMAGEWNDAERVAGSKITVSEALSSGFPFSDNVAAISLVIELGKKYCGCSDINEAYDRGLEFLNSYLAKKGYKTRLSSAAGFNTGSDYNYANFGISESQTYGSCPTDISNCLIELYKNDIFIDSLTTKTKDDETLNKCIEKHATVKNLLNENNILTCADLSKDNPKDGLYFIKSGTQAYNSGTFVIIDNGNVNFLSIQGINSLADGGNYIKLAGAIYQHYFNN